MKKTISITLLALILVTSFVSAYGYSYHDEHPDYTSYRRDYHITTYMPQKPMNPSKSGLVDNYAYHVGVTETTNEWIYARYPNEKAFWMSDPHASIYFEGGFRRVARGTLIEEGWIPYSQKVGN